MHVPATVQGLPQRRPIPVEDDDIEDTTANETRDHDIMTPAPVESVALEEVHLSDLDQSLVAEAPSPICPSGPCELTSPPMECEPALVVSHDKCSVDTSNEQNDIDLVRSDAGSTSRPKRNRKPPAWLQDYAY